MKRISPSDKLPRKRAILEKDKISKRSNIILAAASLLLKRDVNDLSMDDVAKKAKVAKGTLYLYFPTKEDLVLRVHMHDYQLWFTDLQKYLLSPDSFKLNFEDWFVNSFENHPRFIKILPIVPTILEKHASYETIKEYKSELLSEINKIEPSLTEKLRFQRKEDTFLFILQCHAIAIGAWSHGFPSATVKQVLNDEGMELFQIDYFSFVKTAIVILQRGFRE